MKIETAVNYLTLLLVAGLIAYLVWFQPGQITARETRLQEQLQSSERERETYKQKADSARKEKEQLLTLVGAALSRVAQNADTVAEIKKTNSKNHEKNEAKIRDVVSRPAIEFLRAFSELAADSVRRP